MLTQVGNLRVIPSTSVLALGMQQLDSRQIADTLRISHILESGLQKVGTSLRVQVRLLDARDRSTLWAETYDREMDGIFAVQDDIARAVTREIEVRLAGRARGLSARRYTRASKPASGIAGASTWH